ncbi:hypothetical protein HAV2_gp05 [Hyperthermophilic Archaeal Virus 2]|uniref:hypothetical protein n=1 Tax=Hyperthermophilic Archaeal Virus 2 TaxID=762906 RepID=UPI0001DBAE18|nr:hypothetical protein HAV2_gp05 [Hyperthermophilic Archaeal Virus 2]ADJ54268.1 hypothetical protein HAV2_gp05 [Hyperthermophilic Archaeal Virus 2]
MAEQPQAGRQVVAPSEGQVSLIIRFTPEKLRQYFEAVRSVQQYVKPEIAAAGVEFTDWDEKVLQTVWKGIMLGTVPLFEVFPISHKDAYAKSYALEVTMHLLNSKTQLESMSTDCLKLFSRLNDVDIDESVLKKAVECIAFAKHAVSLGTITALHTLEFVHRKAQFSLPAGLMPNSAKGVAGVWTD